MKLILKNKLAFAAIVIFCTAIWVFYAFVAPTELFYNKDAIIFAIWTLLTLGYTVCAVGSIIKKEPLRPLSITLILADVFLVATIILLFYVSLAFSE